MMVNKEFATVLQRKMESYVEEGKEITHKEETFVSSTDLTLLIEQHIEPLLKERLKRVVVFDIDSTLLFHLPLEGINVVAPAKVLYDMAIRYRHLVYIVTARPNTASNRKQTIDELNKLGIRQFRELFMAPSRLNTNSGIAHFKACAREYIAAHERQPILLNVGDRWTDLIPFISEKGVVLFEQEKDTCTDVVFILFSSPKPYDQVVLWNLKVPDEIGLRRASSLQTPFCPMPSFQMNRPMQCPLMDQYR